MQQEVRTRQVPAVRLLAMRGSATSQPEIAGVVGPMFEQVAQAIVAAGGRPGTAVASYRWAGEGGPVEVLAGFTWAGDEVGGFEVVDLPTMRAATLLHLGAMDTIGQSWMVLDRWIGAQGLAFDGDCREVYLETGGDQSTWVTELQQPVTG